MIDGYIRVYPLPRPLRRCALRAWQLVGRSQSARFTVAHKEPLGLLPEGPWRKLSHS
jgi:hypothetical protein